MARGKKAGKNKCLVVIEEDIVIKSENKSGKANVELLLEKI